MTVNAITDTKRENRDCAYLSSNYPMSFINIRNNRGPKINP